MTLTIRPATLDDLEIVAAMHREATEWLASKGLDQWQPRPDGRQGPERVRLAISRSIERGECYLAVDSNEPVGTITVDTYADPEFWTADDRPDEALYVHRMIVRRSHAGAGVGKALLDFAAELAAQAGRKWLRLDAWRTNTALHDYYRRQGFQHVRTLEYSHRGSGALFQRRATG